MKNFSCRMATIVVITILISCLAGCSMFMGSESIEETIIEVTEETTSEMEETSEYEITIETEGFEGTEVGCIEALEDIPVENEEITAETNVTEKDEIEEITISETPVAPTTVPVQTTVAPTQTEPTQAEILTYPVSETPSYWTDNGYTINSYQVDGVGTVYGYYLSSDNDLISLANSLRAENGIDPYGAGDQSIANIRAIESAYMGISHTRPNGQDIGSSFNMCAENTTSAGGAYNRYFDSPGHYANMLYGTSAASASFQLMIWTPCEYFPEGGYWTVGESANVLCIW